MQEMQQTFSVKKLSPICPRRNTGIFFVSILCMARNNFEVVQKYCDDILSGSIIAGKYTILAVKRFREDLEKSRSDDFPYILDVSQADAVIDFAESLVIPDIAPSEENPKRQLRLLPWMQFVYFNLFGWVYKDDKQKRRFNDAYIEVARKNSKTTSLLFPMILFDFLTTNASESYMVSKSDEQSKKSFKELLNIVKENKELNDSLSPGSQAITFQSSRIAFFCDGSVGVDGYKPSFSVIDEYHEYDSDKIVTAFRYGGRARKNRTTIKITSAGLDVSKPCYAENLAAKKLLEQGGNDHQFAIIYAYDSGDDWKNTDLLKKANPSMDELPNLTKSVLLEDLVDCLEKPWHQPDYISKTCGIWTQDTASWIPLEKFRAYQPGKLNDKDYLGLPCALAFDLSNVNDMSVLTRCYPMPNGERHLLHDTYIPEDTLQERFMTENVNFRDWANNGLVKLTRGAVVDYDYIYDDIARYIQIYKPFCLYYDQWHSNELIKRIEENFPKLLVVPFSQSLKNMSPATKDYEEKIYKQKIVDPSPITEWMLGNVVIRPDRNGNYSPEKKSKASKKHIDIIITSIMANMACNECAPKKQGFDSFEDLLAVI